MNRRPLFTWLAAVAALAYLVVMTVAGALPQQKQLVKFEAKGIMKVEPESITRVKVEVGPKWVMLVRKGEGWSVEGGMPVAPELAKRISLAVQFMNTSGPLRTMDAPELTGSNPRDFGLQFPRVRATLYRNNEIVLVPVFGAYNSDDTAQYMALENKPDIYLMSRFVGQAWEAVMEGLFAPASRR